MLKSHYFWAANESGSKVSTRDIADAALRRTNSEPSLMPSLIVQTVSSARLVPVAQVHPEQVGQFLVLLSKHFP